MSLLREEGAQAERKAQRAVILQPGAIGDCILTIPLAKFMKDSLGLGGIDILGHTEYIGILPGRTCIDGIRSIDSMDLHRLFVQAKTFDLVDEDPLINAFADYAWIATFLGEPDSDFEQNLIYTANCSHSAEIITLSMKPPAGFWGHLTDFYIWQFIEQSGLSLKPSKLGADETLLKPTESDRNRGRELLGEMDIDADTKMVVIQPGSGSANKCWHLDNFLAVAEELRARDFEVIFLLGPAELDRFSQKTINRITGVARCLMDLSLTQVLGLLSCADIFLGNDSGITHLAAGLGIRTLTVFGPTNPAVYGPIGPAVRVFVKSSPAFAKKPLPSLQKDLLEILIA